MNTIDEIYNELMSNKSDYEKYMDRHHQLMNKLRDEKVIPDINNE